MSDFQALMGEDTDYGADGTPVHPEEPATVAENMTEVMGDTMLNQQGENMAAETQDEPLPPAPADITGQDGLHQCLQMSLWTTLPTPLSNSWKHTPKIIEMFSL